LLLHVLDLESGGKSTEPEKSWHKGGAFFSMRTRAPTAASWDFLTGKRPPGSSGSDWWPFLSKDSGLQDAQSTLGLITKRLGLNTRIHF
jgi:hypothetical protein